MCHEAVDMEGQASVTPGTVAHGNKSAGKNMGTWFDLRS